MATINVFLNVEILACVRIQLEDGSYGTHLLIDDKDMPALQASGLADWIENEVDLLAKPVAGKGELGLEGQMVQATKPMPAKWLKDGSIRHEFLGLTPQTSVVAVSAAPIELPEEPV